MTCTTTDRQSFATRIWAGMLMFVFVFVAGAAMFAIETVAAYCDHGHGSVTRVAHTGKQARYFIASPSGEREIRGWLTLVPRIAVGDVVVKRSGSMFLERYAPGTPATSDAVWTFDLFSIVSAGSLMGFLAVGLMMFRPEGTLLA